MCNCSRCKERRAREKNRGPRGCRGIQGLQGMTGSQGPQSLNNYAEFQFTVPVSAPLIGIESAASGVQGSTTLLGAAVGDASMLTTPAVPVGITFFLFNDTLIADPTGNITIDPLNSENIRIRDGGVYEFTYYVLFQCTPNVAVGQMQLAIFLNSTAFPDYTARNQQIVFLPNPSSASLGSAQQTSGGPTRLPPLPPNSIVKFRIVNGPPFGLPITGLNLITSQSEVGPAVITMFSVLKVQ